MRLMFAIIAICKLLSTYGMHYAYLIVQFINQFPPIIFHKLSVVIKMCMQDDSDMFIKSRNIALTITCTTTSTLLLHLLSHNL